MNGQLNNMNHRIIKKSHQQFDVQQSPKKNT